MTIPGGRPEKIRVFSGGAPQRVLSQLAPAFEEVSGVKVDIDYEIVSQLQERVTGGDHPDLILAPAQVISAIGENVPLLAEASVTLASVGVGMIVRAGAPIPYVSSDEAFLSALRHARAIVLADPRTPTGKHLARVFDRLGIAGELQDRLFHKGAIHGGGELVATGRADIGLFLVSEVQFIDGVTVAGLLPPVLQQDIVYTTGIPRSAHAPEGALAFIRFLTGSESAPHWIAGGFKPAST